MLGEGIANLLGSIVPNLQVMKKEDRAGGLAFFYDMTITRINDWRSDDMRDVERLEHTHEPPVYFKPSDESFTAMKLVIGLLRGMVWSAPGINPQEALEHTHRRVIIGLALVQRKLDVTEGFADAAVLRKHMKYWRREHDWCAHCHHIGGKLKYCALCETAAYCNRECQAAHWRIHKRLCGRWKPWYADTESFICDVDAEPAHQDQTADVHTRAAPDRRQA